jgi:hypothetical protein
MIELTKPSERLQQDLELAFSDYLQDPCSQRRANIVARAADDHVEWTFKYRERYDPSRLNGRDLKSFRANLISQCPALQMMSDLADAADHRILTREHTPPRVVTVSTAAYYEDAGVLRVHGFDTSFPSAAEQVVKFLRNYRE